MQIDVEAAPLQDFIPIPSEAERRHVRVGQFGALYVYVFDPYSIALSKIERGFESDLEDVVFLLRQNLITLHQLGQTIQESLQHAQEFDLDASKCKRVWTRRAEWFETISQSTIDHLIINSPSTRSGRQEMWQTRPAGFSRAVPSDSIRCHISRSNFPPLPFHSLPGW